MNTVRMKNDWRLRIMPATG